MSLRSLIDADLADVIYNTDDFAVAAVHNGTTTVNGIFSNEYIESFGGQSSQESSVPVFSCATADVPSAAHGDTFLIEAITYTVRAVEPDGTGVTRMILRSP